MASLVPTGHAKASVRAFLTKRRGPGAAAGQAAAVPPPTTSSVERPWRQGVGASGPGKSRQVERDKKRLKRDRERSGRPEGVESEASEDDKEVLDSRAASIRPKLSDSASKQATRKKGEEERRLTGRQLKEASAKERLTMQSITAAAKTGSSLLPSLESGKEERRSARRDDSWFEDRGRDDYTKKERKRSKTRSRQKNLRRDKRTREQQPAHFGEETLKAGRIRPPKDE